MKNLTVSTTLQKRMGFYEVTGGPRRASRPRACREPPGRTTRGRKARPSRRALFFRNVSMGEIPPEAGRKQNSPVDTLLKRLSPDPWIGKLKKSLSSLMKYELFKDLIVSKKKRS